MVRTKQKRRVGYVISDKMEKTIIVRVDRRVRHPMYGKVLTLRSRFMVHDPTNTVKLGDLVEIQESRPQSKLKRWKVLSVLEVAKDIAGNEILRPLNNDEVMGIEEIVAEDKQEEEIVAEDKQEEEIVAEDKQEEEIIAEDKQEEEIVAEDKQES
jgi:small subunit ribosomal protein S17